MPQTVRENIYLSFHSIVYPEIMAFTILFVPPKKVPFPKILYYPNSFVMKSPRQKNRTDAATEVFGEKRPATLLKKRLQHSCFPVKFAKFLRAPFLQNISG